MRISVVLATLIVGSFSWPVHAETQHHQKLVEVMHSPDTRECVFFTLVGVTTADPLAPNDPWFAVAKTHAGYKEIVSILMIARITNVPVRTIVTSGGIECGHPSVRAALL